MAWTELLANALFLPVLLVSLVVGLLFLLWRKPENLPPGPKGLPLIGYVPFLGTKPFETYMKLKEEYGPVLSIPMGMSHWIVLNDFDSLNEAFVKQGDRFSGRPDILSRRGGGLGVASIDYGQPWKDFRRFGIKTLRGFGVGKRSMEDNIRDEMPYLIDYLTTIGEDTLLTKLTLGVSNIICRVVFGSRFDYDNKKFRRLNEVMNQLLGNTVAAKLHGLAVVAPFLCYIPPFKGAVQFIDKEMKDFGEIMKDVIDEHKKTYSKDETRDFIDAFLKEMAECGEGSPFTDKHMEQYIRDIFIGGSGTTSSTLHWSILLFLHYPECQRKIAEEVQDVIGESGIPSMKHREQMPYTCAFVQEVMRFRPLVPLGVPHKANNEAVINGYIIPKNSTVISNLWAVHFDPNVYENPKEFRPERFISSEGKFVNASQVIPFSVGPRHCLGEQLARMEVFIFLTSIVQKLRVELSQPSLPSLEEGSFNMFTYEAPNFEVKFEHR